MKQEFLIMLRISCGDPENNDDHRIDLLDVKDNLKRKLDGQEVPEPFRVRIVEGYSIMI